MWTEYPFQCLAGLSEQTTNNIVEYVFCVENRICLILPKHPPPLTPGSCRVITFFTPPPTFQKGRSLETANPLCTGLQSMLLAVPVAPLRARERTPEELRRR